MTIVTARLHSLWLTIHSVKVVSNAGNFTIPVRWPFGCFATASFFFSPVSDHGIVYFSPSSMLLDYILHSNGWNWTGPMEPWTIFGPFLDHFLDHFFRHFLNHFWTIYFYYLLSPQYLYSGLAYKLYEKCLYIKESILVVMHVVIFWRIESKKQVNKRLIVM